LGRFKVFGLWGNSYIELGREASDTTENSYNAKGTATDFGSGLGVIGMANTYYFNDKTRLKTTLSYQRTSASTKLDSLKSNGEFLVPFVRQNQAENKLSFTTQFRQKINSRNNYSIGLIVDRYNIDYLDSINLPEYDHFITYANITGDMMMYRAYGQWQHKFNDQLLAYSGLHLQLFGMNNELAVEPRLGIKWQFSEKQSVNAGFGMHSQIQPKSIYYFQTYVESDNSYFKTNEDVRFSRSNHFVLGYNRLINSHFRVKMESYYQQLRNIPIKETFPEFSLANAGDFFGLPQEDSLVNEGKGKNYGVELTVEKFLSRGYYFLFTASIFDSKYTGYDGVWRNTAFNGNYVFNLLGGYEHKLGQNTMLTLDIRTVWAGGRRFVPVDESASILEGKEVRDWSRAYEDKYSDYFRTDFRIGIKLNGKKTSQEWGVDLQNITGYKSVFMESWDTDASELYTVYQQGFVPMFLWRIQF